MLNSARRTDEMCGAADGIRHGAAAVRRNTVSAAYIRCRSSKQQTTVAARCQDHGSTARLTCGAVSKLTLSRETGHSSCGTSPESAQTAGGFAAEKRTSDTSLIIIHQKKDVCQYRRRRIFPFAEYGDVFRPRKRGRGGGGGTPVSGVRTETNVNAQRRTCRTEVWKKCMHQTHPAARKSAFRIINTAHSA